MILLFLWLFSLTTTCAQPFIAGCWEIPPDGSNTFSTEYSFGNAWPAAQIQAWSVDLTGGGNNYGPFAYPVSSQTYDGSTLSIQTSFIGTFTWTFTTVTPTSMIGSTTSQYGTFPFTLIRPTRTPTFCDAVTPPPTPPPTPAPTPSPTPSPTPNPTPEPTPSPTPLPTPMPTPAPTPEPTPMPTPQPVITLPPPGSEHGGDGGSTRTAGAGPADGGDRSPPDGSGGNIVSDGDASGVASGSGGDSGNIGVIVGCAVGGILFLLGILLLVFYVVKKRKQQHPAAGNRDDGNSNNGGVQLQPVYQAPSGISPTMAIANMAGRSEGLQPVYAPPSAISNPRVSEAIIGTYEAPQLTRTTTEISFMTGGSTGELYVPLQKLGSGTADTLVLSRDIANRPAAPLPPEAHSTMNFGYPNIHGGGR
jgi:hypothetical protein